MVGDSNLLCGVFVIGSSSPDKVVGEVRVHMSSKKSGLWTGLGYNQDNRIWKDVR